jgi:hypothetical protein
MPDWRTDEYDSYLPGVVGLLQKGASADEAGRYLRYLNARERGLNVTTSTAD